MKPLRYFKPYKNATKKYNFKKRLKIYLKDNLFPYYLMYFNISFHDFYLVNELYKIDMK